MAREGLRVPQRRRKRRRLGDSTVSADRRAAEHIDHVWSIDVQFDVTADGRTFKLCNLVDEYTREALAIHVDRSIDADTTVAVLDKVVADRGRHPGVHPLRQRPRTDRPRPARLVPPRRRRHGLHRPGAPWQNPFIESLHSRLRDEYLGVEQFDTLLEAQVVIGDWRIDYNYNRPHSALGMLAPADYAAQQDPPELS